MPTLAELAGYGDDPSTTGGGLLGLLTSFIDNRKRGLLNNVQGGPGLLGTRINESARDFNREERSWMGAERSVIPELRDMAGQRTLNQALNMGGLLGLHTVYHGSPHKFDKFDASKIGTGEGAQAYGHGLYFAESPEVAGSYRAALSGDELLVGGKSVGHSGVSLKTPEGMAAGLMDQYGSVDAARSAVNKFVDQLYWPKSRAESVLGVLDDVAKKGVTKRQGGALYKADLPDEWLPKMLDWDKPLSQQPAPIRRAVLTDARQDQAAYLKALSPEGRRTAAKMLRDPENLTNGKHDADWKALYRSDPNIDHNAIHDIHSAMNRVGSGRDIESFFGGGPRAAEQLKALGVPGVKYKDGGSRGTEGGTHNYVVFPGMEKYLKILGIE
jgi:hypothetical protein